MKFYKLDKDIAARLDLTAADKILLAIIRDRQGQNGKAWPGLRKLGDDAGVDKATVKRSIERLADKGLLTVEPRGRGKSHFYHVIDNETVRKMQTVGVRKMQTPKKSNCPQNAPTGVRKMRTQVSAKCGLNQTDPLNQTVAQQKKPVLTFPTKGGDPWGLTQDKLHEYQETYPGVDVLGELRRARQWCLDNPGRCKTAKGMPKFCGGWLGRKTKDDELSPQARALLIPRTPTPEELALCRA